ncbi:MAG TPA: chemotaxis protein CheW [Candidatus Krumholzibacteria bacterium]|nr:chemotaxis protein CheW [Candidatus Krumholzibacteria bacterium]
MSAANAPGRREKPASGKYLTFFLGKETYGLEILQVKELIGYQDITGLPQAPMYVKGVINLRDTVIPIVDLRCRFGMPEIEPTEQTCIVVVQVNDSTIGLLVDRVSEVQDIGAKHIEGPPTVGRRAVDGFVRGISKAAGRVTLLLDIDCIVDEAAEFGGPAEGAGFEAEDELDELIEMAL